MARASSLPVAVLLAVILAVTLLHGVHAPASASQDAPLDIAMGTRSLQSSASASWANPATLPLAFPGYPDPAVAVDLPVLMYHHVKDPSPNDSDITRGLTVEPADFDQQMEYLEKNGFETVSMRELYRALFYGEALPDKAVLLSFDDGYADNYTVAAPILRKHGLKGTFFIISGLVGGEGYMSWDQVKGLEDMGMEIGSHTATHPDLTTLDEAGLQAELAGSASTLAGELGHPVYWLCYPSGAYDANVIDHATAAGYLAAVTTKPGESQASGSPYELLRWRINPGTTLQQFANLVE